MCLCVCAFSSGGRPVLISLPNALGALACVLLVLSEMAVAGVFSSRADVVSLPARSRAQRCGLVFVCLCCVCVVWALRESRETGATWRRCAALERWLRWIDVGAASALYCGEGVGHRIMSPEQFAMARDDGPCVVRVTQAALCCVSRFPCAVVVSGVSAWLRSTRLRFMCGWRSDGGRVLSRCHNFLRVLR